MVFFRLYHHNFRMDRRATRSCTARCRAFAGPFSWGYHGTHTLWPLWCASVYVYSGAVYRLLASIPVEWWPVSMRLSASTLAGYGRYLA